MNVTDYPTVQRSTAALPGIIDLARRHKIVGHDLEFNTSGYPTVGCIAAGVPGNFQVVALQWSLIRDALRELAADPTISWVGHAFLTVDRSILNDRLGTNLPTKPDRIHDTYIYQYLCNQDFCKDSAKDEDDIDHSRGAGYLDLWSMASIYTDVPQWKKCRGPSCGRCCPVHDFEGYNGLDGLVPLMALERLLPELYERTKPQMIEHMYECSLMAEAMQRKGIRVDMKVAQELDELISSKRNEFFQPTWVVPIGKRGQPLKPRKAWKTPDGPAPFSPTSPKAILAWFEEQGVTLKSANKTDLRAALRRVPQGEARDYLQALVEFKSVGKDTKGWLGDKYRDADDFIHPRFLACGTSSGRWASSNPNFQNLIKRAGIGKTIKRALVPRDDSLQFVKADAKQLELRKALWNGGDERDFGMDAFNWLVDQAPDVFTRAAELSPDNKSPRDCAKRTTHAMNLHEGINLLDGNQLQDSYVRQMERNGALRIHRDWLFEWRGREYVVAYTGVNLAKSLFGSASRDNRKAALELQDSIRERFPALREWHRGTVERAKKGFVRSRSGRFLTLRGSGTDAIKLTATMEMQGESSDYIQEAGLLFYRQGWVPSLMVHDEWSFEVPAKWSKRECYDFISQMNCESKFFPGFRCPIDVEVGPNLYDCEKVEVNK